MCLTGNADFFQRKECTEIHIIFWEEIKGNSCIDQLLSKTCETVVMQLANVQLHYFNTYVFAYGLKVEKITL